MNWFDLLKHLDYLSTSVNFHHIDGLLKLLGTLCVCVWGDRKQACNM